MREIIGNTTATPNPRPDWLQTDENKADYIKNKPTVLSENEIVELIKENGGDVGVQSDWNQTDETQLDYIQNKPPTGNIVSAEITNAKLVLTQNQGLIAKGDKGDTPIKGVDYFTTEEQAEIVSEANRYTDQKKDEIVECVKNIFANAVKDTQSDVVVALDGVSPVKHKVDVGLRSKNLIPYPYINTTQTKNGVTFTDNGDGSITINGTPTALTTHVIYLGHNAYKFSAYTSCYAGGKSIIADGLCMSLQGDSDSTIKLAHETGNNPMTYILVVANVTYDNVTVYPQLEYGTVATPYTPYVPNDKAVTVKSCGKNLLDGSVYEDEQTTNGVTIKYIPEEDAYLINGTATATVRRESNTLKIPIQDKVTFSVEYISGSAEKGTGAYTPCFYVGYSNNLGEARTNWDGINFINANNTATSKEAKAILNSSWFYITAGNVFNNYKCRIMVEKGSTATTYEPYIEGETIETTLADGAQLDSIAPNMTITTDTNGAIIDANYACDTKAYIDRKFNELAAAIIGG